MVLIARLVKLTTLLATLLKEATDGRAMWVLCVAIAVCNLQPLELDHGRDIGIDCTLRKQRLFSRRSRRCRHEGRRGHIALAVVCKQLGDLD